MENRNKVTVRIHNREYTVVASESVEYIHKVADHVDRIMCGIISKNPSMSYSMAAILSAMNVADGYFKVLSEADKLKAEGAQAFKQLEGADREVVRLKSEVERLKIINARLQATIEARPSGNKY